LTVVRFMVCQHTCRPRASGHDAATERREEGLWVGH
jgi:hypothetical protein